MTNENTATATDTSNEAAPAKKAYFFQRFGKMTRVDIRRGRKGEFARIEIDCGKFTETAYAFNASVVEKIKAAGEGAEIWMKGPKEPMQRKNEQGGTYSEEVLKVIYFKDKSAEAAPEAAAEEAPVAEVPAEPQDLTAIHGIGAKVAEKLNAAGVTTYAALASMSAEEFDAISAGMAARAEKGLWVESATGLAASTEYEAKIAEQQEAEGAF
jgi:predicted flap endonuclease-1-like 5' DNA nuclease